MNRLNILLLSILLSLRIFINGVIEKNIDNTMSLINEQMVIGCISKHSLLEAYEYNDVSYLVINQKLLRKVVEKTLSNNLKFIDYEVFYYFYDSTNEEYKQTIKGYCNSVQIKIQLTYNFVCTDKIIRFEPTIT